MHPTTSDEGYGETTPRETSGPQGEQDSVSLESEDLYLDIPRTNDTTEGNQLQYHNSKIQSISSENFYSDIPRTTETTEGNQLHQRNSIIQLDKGQRGRKFANNGVSFLIFLLFIGLGILTYMVLDLKKQLKNSEASSIIKQMDLEKKLNNNDKIYNQQLMEKNETINRLKIKNEQSILSVLRNAAYGDVVTILEGIPEMPDLHQTDILSIFTTASENKQHQVLRYLFGILPKYLPGDLESLSHIYDIDDQYRDIYRKVTTLVLRIQSGFNDGSLLIGLFQMYGDFIISYERHMRKLGDPRLIHGHPLFNLVMSKFLNDQKIKEMKKLEDIEKQIISNHYADGSEKAFLKNIIRRRAKEGLKYLKQAHDHEGVIRLYLRLMLTKEEQEDALLD